MCLQGEHPERGEISTDRNKTRVSDIKPSGHEHNLVKENYWSEGYLSKSPEYAKCILIYCNSTLIVRCDTEIDHDAPLYRNSCSPITRDRHNQNSHPTIHHL